MITNEKQNYIEDEDFVQEGRLDKLTQKLDKFTTNPKTIFTIIVFLICSLAVVFASTATKLKSASQLANEIASLEKQNSALSNQNQILQSQGTFESEISSFDKQIFSNGTDAIVTAFENLNNYSSYEIEAHGTTSSDAPVVGTVPIDMQGYAYKYQDGFIFDRMFQDDVYNKVGLDSALEIVIKDGKKYTRRGNLVTKDGKLDGEFSADFKYFESKCLKHNFYIVNKSTIQSCKFSIKKDKGKILYYQVVANLDPKLAVKGHDIDIMEQGGTTLPTFNYIELTCQIDKDGNLMNYVINEQMNLSKHIPVLGYVSTTTTNLTTNTILSFNKEPSVEKPTI